MSQQWKQFERDVAAVLGGARVVRADYGESDFDVKLSDFPQMKVDAKRYKRHAHHSLLREAQKKYCKLAGQYPVLVTRENGRPLKVVSLPLEDFAGLLEEIRSLREQLEIRKTAEAL